MGELIDREAVLDECLNHYEVGNIEQNCTMDWICKTVRNFPAASPWHRVEEPPIEYQRCMVYSSETRQMVSGVWTAEYGWMIPGPIGKLTHWMPIDPPKEDAR